MKQTKVRDMVLGAMFVALIAIGAFIKIPVPPVPITLQFLFVMMAALLLGTKLSVEATCVYILLGLIGVPIFTEGGGLFYVLKPTFGYLIGFIASALIIGKIAHKTKTPSMIRLLAANFAGLFVLYGIGMIYFYLINTLYLGNTIGAKTLFVSCFLLFLPGNGVECILGAILGKILIPIVYKIKNEP